MHAMLKKIKIIKPHQKKKDHSSHVPMPTSTLGGSSTESGMSSGAGMAEGGAVGDNSIVKQAGQATAPASSNALKVVRKTPFGQPDGSPAANAEKKNYYFGGPVSGSESGAFPGRPENAEEEFDFNKRRGEIMGNEKDDFCGPTQEEEAPGSSFACGGEVKKEYAEGGAIPPEAIPEDPNKQAVEPDGAKTAAPDAAPGPEHAAPEALAEESTEGVSPFKEFAKTPGIDAELVRKGDSIYQKIEQALNEGDKEAAGQYIEELRLLVSDIKKKSSEGKISPEAAAAYKAMSADAGDLLAGVENISKEIGSPESMAAKS